jgi:hypothetical protein
MSGHIGRAKTVLVLRDGEGEQALITDIICRIAPRTDGLTFHGPGAFSYKTRRQLEQTVLKAVRSILSALELPHSGFMISAVNLGAASHDDRELIISGFSADTAVFLAMMSSALEIALPNDLLSTGHLASPDGDVRMVGSLPAKLAAAELDPEVNTFLHPDARNDDSLKSFLNEEELQSVEAALAKFKRSLKLTAFRNVADLLHASFSEDHIVLTSLKKDYFGRPCKTESAEGPLGEAINTLASRLEARFWLVMERFLCSGHSRNAKELFKAYLDYHVRQGKYPPNLGKRLHQIMVSLPPHTRRLKLKFPLIPANDCIKLAQFAQEDQGDDVTALLKAVSGDFINQVSRPESDSPGLESGDHEKKLEVVLSMISSESLGERIKLPIDNARAVFQLDSVLVDNHEVFNETITAFYIHLIRKVRGIIGPAEHPTSCAEAHDLLSRTYARDGGYRGALAEASGGLKGGMRFILDAMTEQFKKEEREKEVNRVLTEALDPLDWNSQVALMEALLERLGPHLPEDIRAQPPERYANQVQLLAKAYAESMDQLNLTFRSL